MKKISRNIKLRDILITIGLTVNGYVNNSLNASQDDSEKTGIPGEGGVSPDTGVLAIFVDELTKYGDYCENGRRAVKRNEFYYLGYEYTDYRVMMSNDEMVFYQGILPINFGLIAPFQLHTHSKKLLGGVGYKETIVCEHILSRCKTLRSVPSGFYWNHTNSGIIELTETLFVEGELTIELPDKSLLYCEEHVFHGGKEQRLKSGADVNTTTLQINSATHIPCNNINILILIVTTFIFIFR